MSQQIAHLAHDHSTSGDRTIQEWAEITRRNPDSVMKQVQRRYGKGVYTRNSVMSADQFAELYAAQEQQGIATKKKSPPSRQQPKTNNPKPEPRKPQPTTAHPFSAYRQPILYTLMAMPAAASVQNMYSVTGDIAAHQSTAILLTGLFSAAPFLFVMAGMRSNWTRLLTGLMIGYECFANTTRVYGGLTGFGHGEFPTRFLGLVTNIFAAGKIYDDAGHFTGYKYQSGTHETAVVLALLMAGLAAATFYAAYYEISKTNRQ